MSRNAILAALVGGLALAAGAVSAEAAPLPKSPAGSEVSTAVVEKAHYRHYRYYRHHHHHRYYWRHHHYRHHYRHW
jgi:hypothetical protein